MPSHNYYWSSHWRRLRAAALRRDGYRCTVEGCGARASIVDHIRTRPRSSEPSLEDVLENLRSLCPHHDAQLKELGGSGLRRRDGVAVVKGCDAEGWPRGRAQ
jgi:5-methylcytosine-specific restriction endonuclease McrA